MPAGAVRENALARLLVTICNAMFPPLASAGARRIDKTSVPTGRLTRRNFAPAVPFFCGDVDGYFGPCWTKNVKSKATLKIKKTDVTFNLRSAVRSYKIRGEWR